MAQGPEPLAEGTVVAGLYQIGPVLGRGGFGITYLADDLQRQAPVAVKELAPMAAIRRPDGSIEFNVEPELARRLRHQFIAEARLLQKLSVRGVPQVRACVQENGTSYYVSEFIPESRTLSRVLQAEGRLKADDVRHIVLKLLDTLAALHRRGILHRDIKPANILIKDLHEPYLIDFGSAREWHHDVTMEHTVLITPGYAPLEQMSRRARRGPATDIYGLCATAYALLMGEPPAEATERASGAPLVSIRAFRPDVDPPFARAIEMGLELRFEDRPQSAEEFLELLAPESVQHEGAELVRNLDEKRVKLMHLRFDRRQCPSCGGVLDEPKPLKKGVCPVCREASLTQRKTNQQVCPCCRVGVLHRVDNSVVLKFCPSCRTTKLAFAMSLIPGSTKKAECPDCHKKLEFKGTLVREPNGEWVAVHELCALSGRSREVYCCDVCEGQFDVMPDGRRKRMHPKPQHDDWVELYPEEWANVAAGLEPGTGNTWCPACEADFFTEGDKITLLAKGIEDPYHYAEGYVGRLLRQDDLPWIGAGKLSGKPGLFCAGCETEFDYFPEGLLLFRSSDKQLRRHADQVFTLPDWHRIAQDLPLQGEEADLDRQVRTALLDAFCRGDVSFDPRDENLVWKGAAFEGYKKWNIVAKRDEISFHRLVKHKQFPLTELTRVSATGDNLELHCADGSTSQWTIEPVQLTFKLESGRETLGLGAEHLARALLAAAKKR